MITGHRIILKLAEEFHSVSVGVSLDHAASDETIAVYKALCDEVRDNALRYATDNKFGYELISSIKGEISAGAAEISDLFFFFSPRLLENFPV